MPNLKPCECAFDDPEPSGQPDWRCCPLLPLPLLEKMTPVLYFDDIPCQHIRAILPSIKPNCVRENLSPLCKMKISSNSPRPNAIGFPAFRLFVCLMTAIVLTFFAAGCGKKGIPTDSAQSSATQQSTAPGPAPTPAERVTIQPAENGDINATLTQLTKELHRTMVGRRLNRNFDEFVALRNLQKPPPPPGKKYAISQQWKVILVNN